MERACQKSSTDTIAITIRGRCRKNAGATFSGGNEAMILDATMKENVRPVIIRAICNIYMDCISSLKAMCGNEYPT